MARINLGALRGRVERMVSAAQSGCGVGHDRFEHYLSEAEADSRPQSVAGVDRCTCGAAIRTIHLFHELSGEAGACAG